VEWGIQIQRAVSEREVALLVQAGIQRVTVPLSWGWVERTRGSWNFAAVDHFLAPLLGGGVPLQGVLGPGISERWPPWVLKGGGADASDYVENFARYCAATVRECNEISVFRVEEDLNAAFWWDGLRTRRRRGQVWRDPSFRRVLLQESCQAIIEARPDVELRLTFRPGLPGWKKDLARLAKAALPVARIGLTLPSSSLFSDPQLGRDVGGWVSEARSILDEAGATTVQLEVARCGYPTHRRRFSPRHQREFLVEASSTAEEAGSAGFHWWSLRDQAHDDPVLGYWTPDSERHMGLLYYDSTPKPAMDELRVLATGDRFGQGGGG
jgi:hypothetical protein